MVTLAVLPNIDQIFKNDKTDVQNVQERNCLFKEKLVGRSASSQRACKIGSMSMQTYLSDLSICLYGNS